MATLLLIDDVELFLELEKSFLQDTGHEVVTMTSAREAFDQLASINPDLVLLDLYMPEMDGDEFCRQLRANPRWQPLPVIMVTAGGKEEDVRRCLEAGCDDYLTKPVNKSELLEKTDRLLGSLKSRTAERTPVSIKVRLKKNGKSLAATARDVSRNGIYVRSRSQLEIGTLVGVQLELPGGHQLQVLGKVKRVKTGDDAGMGIYFIHPEPQGLDELESFARTQAEQEDTAPPASVAGPGIADDPSLTEKNRQLMERIAELEQENLEFAEQLVLSEEVNNNLTNLYVASSKLHSVLDRDQVVDIIKEVVINFVGAEKFALLLCDKEQDTLVYKAGEGFDDDDFAPVAPGDGIIGEACSSGEIYLQEGPVAEGSDDRLLPIAAIPLKMGEEVSGVLAIHRLFVQKETFALVDHQLFSMLAEHAATALFSATLYGQSERKRKTYQGMMDLLLK